MFKEQPPVWFHEVFYQDGKPYRERKLNHPRADGREMKGTSVWGGRPRPPFLTWTLLHVHELLPPPKPKIKFKKTRQRARAPAPHTRRYSTRSWE